MLGWDGDNVGEADPHMMPLDRRKSVSTTAGDGDTCRICRGEGTLDQPLFYPCKCSGSIRYVHQDCLMEWLSHSQKKYCELCKTPFRFTKLYDKSMPSTLPLPLFFRQVGVHIVRTLARWLRYVFVTFIWTCWLPWSIRQIWRGLFWLADGSWMTPLELKTLSPADTVVLGDNTTLYNLSEHLATHSGIAPTVSESYFDPVGELFNLLTGAPLLRGLLRLLTSKSTSVHPSGPGTNTTVQGLPSLSQTPRQPSLLSNMSSLNSLTRYQLVNNGLIDVLEGQLICLSVIAAFILVFLIREWVINQQPILNMPNPDRADVRPAPIQPNEDGRQQERRRRRGIRRQPEHDGLVNMPQRAVPMPRPRRAVTAEDITTHSHGQLLERPNVPPRASSLVHETTSQHGIFKMDMDSEPLWNNPGDALAPRLQRGMFDEVVDIRRNIEERAHHSSDENLYIPPGQTNNMFSGLEGEESTSLPFSNSLVQPDSIQRTDFVSGRLHRLNSSGVPVATSHSSSPLLNGRDFQLNHEEDLSENAILQDPNNLWDQQLNEDLEGESADSSDDTPQLTPTDNTDDFQVPFEVEAHEDLSFEDPESSNAEDALPETTLGRIAQWMWHTDEQIRTLDQLNEQVENEAVHHGNQGAHPLPAGDPNGANAVPAQANPPPREPNIQFGIDLNDPNALDDAEDLEGILELIGMEGPLAGMIQNIIFSVFLITLTLSASVWCPYIWGKIAILIMSNPIGVFFKAPLFFTSKCGNILIDLLLFVSGMVGYALSKVAKIIRVILLPALPGLANHIKVAVVENWTLSISQNSGVRLEKALSGTIFGLRPDLPTFSMQSHHALRIYRKAFVEASSAISHDFSSTLKGAEELWQSHGLLGAPVFVLTEVASFPNATLDAVKRFGTWWQVLVSDLQMRPLSEMLEEDIALVEWTTDDKVLAILVGYAFFAAAGFAYLRIAHIMLGLKNDEKVEGMLADSLRQAGGVLKVIVIIGIEMIAFPLYCGTLLDCALLPLFKDATFQTRLSFLVNAPVTCLFIHWFVGTCYMFHFALFVSMCRKIMRKGVLYFIRDPDDPTFHPVRDVLERPVATQLGKIAFSALVYGGLVIVCLGGVVWTVGSVSGILPINWTTNEPRLALPVDIIFYNFMLPLMLRRAEPSKKISMMYEWWFRQCARNLRLSHFLFGEEREDEKFESHFVWQSESPNIDGTGQNHGLVQSFDQAHRDGRYVRAPAADSVRIPKGTKVFVEVNEDNERVDGEQDLDTGMHGKKDDRFVKIYVPPHFRARVSIFVFLVWLFAASTGTIFTVMPLLTGRWLLRMLTASTAPNDLYAFTIGMHICGVVTFAGYLATSRRDWIYSKASDLLTNTKEYLPRLYGSIKHISGLIYLFTTVFVILPFATSLLTELYIHMPIYSYFASNFSAALSSRSTTISEPPTPINPTIFVLQTWTLGLLYMRLALRLVASYPSGQNRPSTALRAIVRNGYLRPDVALASRALVFPAFILCTVLLAAPIGLARLVILVTNTVNQDDKLQLYRYSYPVLLAVAISIYIALGVQHKIEGWRIKVRDEVYLVGERLHNFAEPETEKTNNRKKNLKVDKGKVRAAVIQQYGHGDGGHGAEENLGHNDVDDEDQSPRIVGHQFRDSENVVVSGSSVL